MLDLFRLSRGYLVLFLLESLARLALAYAPTLF